ncbi:MAG: hypothetical protein ACYCSN_05410 [Acidobacteriaceae bacterium]
MRKQRLFLFHAPLLLLGFSLLACGSVSQLESISINPVAATAQDSASGTVQFTATGTYTDGHTVSPLSVFWGEHAPWIEIPDPGGVTVNSNGLAQCTTFKGTVPIVAIAPKNPDMPLFAMTMATPVVSATAHLTCK